MMTTGRCTIGSGPMALLAGFVLLGATAAAAPADQAAEILKASGVKGGIVVHLGCGDGSLTAALHANDSYQVHGLARSDTDIALARKTIQDADLYGPVAVDRLDGDTLPYIDQFVNLFVAEDLGSIPMAEVTRVLVPNGVAYIKRDGQWSRVVKPRPDNIDDWTHFMHDATGNAVAHDDVVAPPRHLQWVGSPRWSRHHDRMASMSALVSSNGRIFSIMDEGSRISIELPAKWFLIGRDAFNGTVLWKRAIEKWHSHLWPLKSGPTQLARRLVAGDNEIYVTLSLEAPLSCLDAATGATIRTYEGTKSTEEVILSQGVLFALVNPNPLVLGEFAPEKNVGDQQRVNSEWNWDEQPRTLKAIEAATGKELWSLESPIAPISLAADARHVVFYNGKQLVCLERSSGDEAWRSEAVSRRPAIPYHFGPKIVLTDQVVLFAGGDREMHGYDSQSGKLLWSAPHDRSGYQSPEDLLVVGGLVWSAPTTSGRDSGSYTGRNLLTGEIEKQFPPDIDTYWFHHRCYMAKATDNFLLPSRTGIEFVDPTAEHWDINHWVRGGCLYGIMPSNGLVYAPPHNCACYPETKIYGFNALAPASVSPRLPQTIDESTRLEKGPAYGAADTSAAGAADWPTYRHDPGRSGTTTAAVAVPAGTRWRTALGGRLSSPVVANGRLYVAAIDSHTVHAIDSASGEKLWSHTAGGRVDSPPTIVAGRVYFGSADGWVYCLRATDGALVWRYRAAPQDLRLAAFEQIESVWPVHGSVLVEDGDVYFVAGRSNFLDGGLRFLRLNAETGVQIAERVINEIDPETGENLQDRVETLQMPVGLPDILGSDGERIYMRSQQFDREGNRLVMGPNSGNPAEQAAVQRGEGAHLFAPMGFTDDTWFHRSYWVFGQSFAGGHNGYFQAGKFAPAGRILVFDNDRVYGFARKPEYYRWTTPLEHELYAAPRVAPDTAGRLAPAQQRQAATTMVDVGKPDGLDPSGKALTVEALVRADTPNGVVLSHGGPQVGYALHISGGRPVFTVRTDGTLFNAEGPTSVLKEWTHLAGTLAQDGSMALYVNGVEVAQARASGTLASNPAQGLLIGADDGGSVGDYPTPGGIGGLIDDVHIYHGALSGAEIARHAGIPDDASAANAQAVLVLDFEAGEARDMSGKNHHGQVVGATGFAGPSGTALQFTGKPATSGGNSGSFVERQWTLDMPLLARGMVLADGKLFVAGPADLVNEEAAFERLVARDPAVLELLKQQDRAIDGAMGGVLQVVQAVDGQVLGTTAINSPPVWDGLIAAEGRLYVSSIDGSVTCLSAK